MTISREQAMMILKEHGLTPDQLTAYNPKTGEKVPGSSFDIEMGFRQEYQVEKIYKWLGY